jgi:anthranilate synthase component 2
MIDNYDSFTYNLVQYFQELGEDVRVFRNDEITPDQIRSLSPDKIVISPGPCTPNEAGVSVPVIKEFAGKIPILGVCLGHQSIGQAFGGKIVRAAKVMHGKTSMIRHDGKGVFKDLENPFEATRYHSLIIEKESLPSCLEMTAWTDEGEIMGVRYKGSENQRQRRVEGEAPTALPVEGATRAPVIAGIQFHPESILTKEGKHLLKNFLDLCP